MRIRSYAPNSNLGTSASVRAPAAADSVYIPQARLPSA